MLTRYKNPHNDYTEDVRSGDVWLLTLLFGSIYLAVKGVWGHALLSLVLALLSSGITWLIYPFFAPAILRKDYLKKGWSEVSLPEVDKKMSATSKVLISVVVLIALLGAIGFNTVSGKHKERALNQEQEHAALDKKFMAEKTSIMENIARYEKEGEYKKAYTLAKKWEDVTNSPTIEILHRLKEKQNRQIIQELVKELKTIPASDIEGNLMRYEELTKLAPNNETYKAKRAYYHKRSDSSYDDNDALTTCFIAIRANARFGDKVDFVGTTKRWKEGSKRIILGKAEMMNGLGLMVPTSYECSFQGSVFLGANIHQ